MIRHTLPGILALACLGTAAAVPQERQCQAQGWRTVTREVAGLQRRLLWKAPDGAWAKGVILVFHGGGEHHYQWCVANAAIVAPQVRFTDTALARGFAVALLESSSRVTDAEGRV